MSFAGNNVRPEKHTGITYKGKEVILSTTMGRPPKGLTAMGMERGIFDRDKTIELATLYAVTGNIETTAELGKVQVKHLRALAKTDEFRAILREVRDENHEKFDAKFSAIVEKAQDELLDRLENGDVKIIKGQEVRVPMNGKDIGVIAAINFDKLQLIRGKPTSRSETTTTSGKLEQLAEKFVEMAKRIEKKPEPEIIDVTPLVTNDNAA